MINSHEQLTNDIDQFSQLNKILSAKLVACTESATDKQATEIQREKVMVSQVIVSYCNLLYCKSCPSFKHQANLLKRLNNLTTAKIWS